jgi:hypothetical protein
MADKDDISSAGDEYNRVSQLNFGKKIIQLPIVCPGRNFCPKKNLSVFFVKFTKQNLSKMPKYLQIG